MVAQFTDIEAAETFFEPLQLHLQPVDLLEQLSLLDLPLLFVLSLFAPGEQLAGSFEQLPLPLTHWIGSHREVRCILQASPMAWSAGDLLDRLAATDRLHGDPGLELGTVVAAFAQLLRRRLRLRWEPPLKGNAPPQRLTMGAVQKSQTTSRRALALLN